MPWLVLGGWALRTVTAHAPGGAVLPALQRALCLPRALGSPARVPREPPLSAGPVA